MKWTLLNTATGVIGTPPSARFGHAMTTIGKKILLFGGKSKTRDEVKLYNDALLFDTEAFQWTLLPQNEAFDALTVRNNHEMVSVGDKVLLFGDDSSPKPSDGENSLLELVFGRVHTWPTTGASSFTGIYDGDIIVIDKDSLWDWNSTLSLCSRSFLPCSLTIQVDLNASLVIHRRGDGVLSCEAARGCTGIALRDVNLSCNDKIVARMGPLQVSGDGAVLSLVRSSISNCHAMTDGGGVRAYNGAHVVLSGCTFRNSSSQVIFMYLFLKTQILVLCSNL